uniref:Uncharacterized protein n=1 Tax=Anguilla anguilla TaxID=7936 RepID=A0A0E9XRT4_ANGAN
MFSSRDDLLLTEIMYINNARSETTYQGHTRMIYALK